MKWTSFAAGLSGFMAPWSIGLLQLVAQTALATEGAFNTEPNPTE